MPTLRVLTFLCALVALSVVLAPAVQAGDTDEKIEALKFRIEVLIEEIHVLAKAGHADAAELLEKRVRALRKELGKQAAKAERAERRDRDEGEHGRRKVERKEQTPITLEPEFAKRYLEALRLAAPAMREVDRHDVLEIVERAIHSMEVQLEGRRDAEAQRIVKQRPPPTDVIEILEYASELYAGWGHESKAKELVKVAKKLLALHRAAEGEGKAPKASRKQDPHADASQRDLAMYYLKMMKMGLGALKEGDRKDLAEAMHRAIRAFEVRLEGRQDKEAQRIYKRSPGVEDIVELIGHAAHLFEKAGKQDRAHALAKARDSFLERHRRAGADERERAHKAAAEAEHGDREARKQLQQLRRQVAELLEVARRLHRELQALQEK